MIGDYLTIDHEVHLSEEAKLKPKYFEDMARHYIMLMDYDRHHIESARNYYSSIRDELDFQYLEDIYGMQNPIDLGFTNIIKPRVDALVGLSLLSEPDFQTHYTDKETIKKVEEKKTQELINDVFNDIKNGIDIARTASEDGKDPKKQKGGVTEDTKSYLDKIAKKYSEEYLSSYQIAANHLIRLIETDAEIDLSNVKKEAAKDFFITGEAYIRELYKGEGKDPKMEVIIPDFFYSNRPKLDKDLKRASITVYKERISPHQVLKKLGDQITKEDAERLFSYYGALSGEEVSLMGGSPDANLNADVDDMHQLDTFYLKTGWINGPLNGPGGYKGPLVDLYHVEWLASTRIPNGKGGFVYREDRYECYRVGYDIYIGGRRCEEAPRTKDEPWKTNLSYRGAVNVSRNGVIHSMVHSMRELQDLYDIIMFFRNNAVANSGVGGSRVNTAAIPKALGKKFMDRLTKWITIRKQGIELIDPTEEGANLFQHYGEFDASIDGNSIQAINAILESLAVQADIISGVPRQMLGIIEERDAVENVRVGLNQVSILSLESFRDIDRLMNRGVQGTLDNFKYAYRKKPLRGVYKNGLAMIPFILQPDDFSTTDYKVTVISGGIENAKLLKIQALAKEFATAGTIDPDILVKIINNKSIAEIEFLLSKSIAKKKEEMQSIGQLEQQLEESNKQVKQLEGEIRRLENNAKQQLEGRLALDKTKVANEYELKGKELSLIERKNKKDNEVKTKEVAIKGRLVDLEREQLLYGPDDSKEVKNNF